MSAARTIYAFDLHPRAESDVREIIAWIANESPDAAADFTRQPRVAAERLCRFPELGKRVRARRPEIRRCQVPRFRKHMILYQLRGTTVRALGVVHGARDLGPILHSI